MEEGKKRCIIKRPDEQYGHVTNISTSLKNLQRIVGGRIEVVPLQTLGAVLICNEEGKILELEPNQFIPELLDVICGDFIVIGMDGEDFADLDMDFRVWKVIVDAWDAAYVVFNDPLPF